MKLFVVGESDPDPQTWSMWSEWALVIAGTPEQAIELSGRPGPACEVLLDEPKMLIAGTEPSWGDDL